MTFERLLQSTFLRFLLVGSSMVGVYALLAAFATSHLPLPRPVSSGVLWLIFIPVGFWLQGRFTFSQSQPGRNALGLYAAVQGLSIVIVATVSYFLAQGTFWHDLIVHLGGSALAAITSYVINRRFIFPDVGPPQD